jgi:hypothetical protein
VRLLVNPSSENLFLKVYSFHQPLGEVVTRLLRSKDLLAAKIGAELIPIIDEKSQQEAITQAFETHSPWICDTTLNSCRLLGTLDQGTYSAIRTYIRSLSLRELLNFCNLPKRGEVRFGRERP